MNLDEMKVTVEVDGERREYTENFIVMHMGEEHGTIIGAVGPVDIVRAVDMLMDSIGKIMSNMKPMDAMMTTILMGKMIEERVKSE